MSEHASVSPRSRRSRWLRILGFTCAALALCVICLVGFVEVRGNPSYDSPRTGITASDDPEIIARGEDLFHGAMHCTACHAPSWERLARDNPIGLVEPTGGQEWDIPGLGTIRAPNLSSDEVHGVGAKSDEHLASVLKHGVGEDGSVQLFMSMAVGMASDEDIQAVISYMRTLPASDHEVAPSELAFGGRAMMAFGVFGPKMLPTPNFVPPTNAPSVERGEYLAKGPAKCSQCHSPHDPFDGMALSAPLFSGCLEAEPGKVDPDVEYCAPNLTPHPEHGRLSNWSEEEFLRRLAAGFLDRNSVMPWGHYGMMSEVDQRSIFRYLQSLDPVARDSGPSVRATGSWPPHG